MPVTHPPDPPDTERLIAAIAAESALLADEFARVLPGDPVPTCPRWTTAELIAHLGGVQRWAAEIVARGRTTSPTEDEMAALFQLPDGASGPDSETVAATLSEWFRTGSKGLTAALSAAPADLEAMWFLKNAPPPRHFWARRQAHEATIHRVDMLAARLGRLPTTSEAEVATDLAADGIDELVRGFLPRRSTRLRTEEPFRIAIRATDVDAGWTIAVSAEPPVTTPGADAGADAELRGTAAALYLGLWNRGDDIAETGAVDALGHWREQVRVRWS